MTILQILGVIAGLAMLIGVPAVMIWAAVDHQRRRPSERRGGNSGPGIGGAMIELDRLVARPSAEHVVEAQTPIVRQADEDGD